MESPLRRDLIPENLEVIETFGRLATGEMPRLERHIGRMCLTARKLGFDFSAPKAREIAAGISGDVAMRCRFSLTAQGLTLTTAPICQTMTSWKVMMSDVALDEKSLWRSMKTSQRQIYDTARANLPGGVDEMIFLNSRGNVAEGTITNIFVLDDDGILLTPPVSSGALPGILRAELLAENKAKVARLGVADLEQGRLYCGNSLRGLIKAGF